VLIWDIVKCKVHRCVLGAYIGYG